MGLHPAKMGTQLNEKKWGLDLTSSNENGHSIAKKMGSSKNRNLTNKNGDLTILNQRILDSTNKNSGLPQKKWNFTSKKGDLIMANDGDLTKKMGSNKNCD